MTAKTTTTVALLLADAMKANGDISEVMAIEMSYALRNPAKLGFHDPLDIDKVEDAPEYTAYTERFIYTSGFDAMGDFVTMSMPHQPCEQSRALADKLKAEGLL